MRRKRVLTIVHNHSSSHPGGTELVAEALHDEFALDATIEPILLAGSFENVGLNLPGTTIFSSDKDPSLYFFKAGGFDASMQSRHSIEPLLHDMVWFLEDQKPDIVFIHHFNHFGVELLQVIRKVRPNAKIILTLHDYYLMCARDGELYTADRRLCEKPDPGECHKCFPNIHEATFRSRAYQVQQHLHLVDAIVSPSQFLRKRFIDWGLSAERIVVIRNGWPAYQPANMTANEGDDLAFKFALLGNLRHTKGQLVAIEGFIRALPNLDERSQLNVYGEALFQTDEFKAKLNNLVDKSDGSVVLHGQYGPDQAPSLISENGWVAVPSLWYENAPLVINEAHATGRPVLCSDIGGMAESVRNGVDGLHVAAGNVAAWRSIFERASGDETLRSQLRAQIKPGKTSEAAARQYLALAEVRRRRRAA